MCELMIISYTITASGYNELCVGWVLEEAIYIIS